MQTQSFCHRLFTFLVGVLMLAASGAVRADPSARVGRLAYVQGLVSFSPAGENDWVEAVVNRPLTTGDRLWVDAAARAEIQDGSAMIRLRANTSVAVLNLDDTMTQLQLTQGVLNVRLRHLAPGQIFEVDTPNLALTMRQNGDFRIAVDADGNHTEVIVRQGQADITGEGADYRVYAQQRYRFSGPDLRLYEFFNAPQLDAFDQWALQRDRAFDESESARFVSPDVIGYQELDANGVWRFDETYGNVWTPSRVDADWAPYRDGHWSWIDPWGWTWVDDAPWGFAVSHYGRWAHIGRAWCWVPGPRGGTAFYAPALVVFVGGANFRLSLTGGSVGGIGWFPLAPHEHYRPAYSVSQRYFEKINRSNTVINDTSIIHTRDLRLKEMDFANRRVPGSVIAVPKVAFEQSQPVFGARVRVNHDQLDKASLEVAAAVAPTEHSVQGTGRAHARPPQRIVDRPVVAATAPPAAHDGFAAQRQLLNLHPGKPLDDEARGTLRPQPAAPQSDVKVLGPRNATPQPQTFPRTPVVPAPSVDTGTRNRTIDMQEQRAQPFALPQPMQQAVPKQVAVPPSAQHEHESAPRVQLPIAAPALTAPTERSNRPQPMHIFRQPEAESPVVLPVQPSPAPMQRVPAPDSRAAQLMAAPVPQVPSAPRVELPRAARPEAAASKPRDADNGRNASRREDERGKDRH